MSLAARRAGPGSWPISARCIVASAGRAPGSGPRRSVLRGFCGVLRRDVRAVLIVGVVSEFGVVLDAGGGGYASGLSHGHFLVLPLLGLLLDLRDLVRLRLLRCHSRRESHRPRRVAWILLRRTARAESAGVLVGSAHSLCVCLSRCPVTLSSLGYVEITAFISSRCSAYPLRGVVTQHSQHESLVACDSG